MTDQITITKVNSLIYGDPGVGKTTLSETALGPVAYFSFDPNGLVSVRDAITSGHITPFIDFEKGTPIDTAESRFELFLDKFEREGQPAKFKTVFLDSVTTWGQSIMDEAIKRAKRSGKSVYDYDHTQLQDYGISQNVMWRLIKRLCSWPCDFVLIAHPTKRANDVTGTTEVRPDFVGKVYKPYLQLVDEIYYMGITKTPQGLERYLLTNNDGVFFARSRLSGKIGRLALKEQPDLKAIREKAGL